MAYLGEGREDYSTEKYKDRKKYVKAVRVKMLQQKGDNHYATVKV